jgi:nicotinamide phosphoribosyltransferase
MEVKLPPQKVFRTPRPLLADAYTVGSDYFQSEKAKEKSTYYIVFRRKLHDVNPDLYLKGDDRIIFAGLSRIIEKLFYEPITHDEIDESIDFLKNFKVTTKGTKPYHFPEEMWRRVVDEFNGRPPIKIEAFPEGSVVYPNEPCMQITSMADGFGELAAWFEAILLQVWAASERVTQNQHWFNWIKYNVVLAVNPEYTNEEANFFTSLMLHDFGARAAMTMEETEELGMYHLLTFPGTDSCAGAYQAWKMSDGIQFGSSVYALAHRNVQAFDKEGDCYQTLYDRSEDGDISSYVADCYDFKNCVESYLIPLAKHAVKESNGKIVVGRPDSGNALEQVIWICEKAIENGLSDTFETPTGTWNMMTALRFLEGDGMKFAYMKKIILAMLEEKIAPHLSGLFGVGGGLRNDLKRDNLSAKYALCAMGNDNQGVVKFSEVPGKSTLPGPFKVLRNPDALENKCTIVFDYEEGESALVTYFDGSNLEEPFGKVMWELFGTWKKRIQETYETMPLSLDRGDERFPASEAILNKRLELLEKYAPNKA